MLSCMMDRPVIPVMKILSLQLSLLTLSVWIAMMGKNWFKPLPVRTTKDGRTPTTTCTMAKMSPVWNVMGSTRKAGCFVLAATRSTILISRIRGERPGYPMPGLITILFLKLIFGFARDVCT